VSKVQDKIPAPVATLMDAPPPPLPCGRLEYRNDLLQGGSNLQTPQAVLFPTISLGPCPYLFQELFASQDHLGLQILPGGQEEPFPCGLLHVTTICGPPLIVFSSHPAQDLLALQPGGCWLQSNVWPVRTPPITSQPLDALLPSTRINASGCTPPISCPASLVQLESCHANRIEVTDLGWGKPEIFYTIFWREEPLSVVCEGISETRAGLRGRLTGAHV
jgi:hypothetical protein